jgi:outer membrane protein OmpA-like peptidoglycan-associated protein
LTGRASQVVWTAPECDALENSTRPYEIQVEVNDGECTVKRIFAISVVCGSGEMNGISEGGAPETTILFASGSTSLNNIAKAKLDALAASLKQSPETTIVLEGHTDATGNENVNKQVGLKRAESVKRYLVQRHGLDANRIVTASYGSQRSAAPNDTSEGRAQNRRVEIYQEY